MWELFFLFLKIGAVTFGGGLAMLPLVTDEFIRKRGWVTKEEVAEYYAIGVCTPGVQAINISTLIGEKRGGKVGGIVATLGFITAPLLCILLLSNYIARLSGNVVYQSALRGIRGFACVIILDAIVRLWKASIKDGYTLLVFVTTIAAKVLFSLWGSDINSVVFVCAALVIGLLRGVVLHRKGEL